MEILSTLAACAAAIAAGVAIVYAGWSASAAQSAVDQQRDIHHEQMQPYVYADFRGAHHTNQLLVLYVKNEGPTVATDVLVTFDRPLMLTDRQGDPLTEWSISAIPPGAHVSRAVGVGFRFLEVNGKTPVKTTVSATGTHGTDQLTYFLDLPAMKKTLAVDSDLNKIRHHLEKMSKSLEKIEGNTRPRPRGQAGGNLHELGAIPRAVYVQFGQLRYKSAVQGQLSSGLEIRWLRLHCSNPVRAKAPETAPNLV